MKLFKYSKFYIQVELDIIKRSGFKPKEAKSIESSKSQQIKNTRTKSQRVKNKTNHNDDVQGK